jgi:hypothetical protein
VAIRAGLKVTDKIRTTLSMSTLSGSDSASSARG